VINGATLTALRERSGLTLTDLAALTGIERSLLGKIERGTRNGTGAQALRLAEALRVPVVAILTNPQVDA